MRRFCSLLKLTRRKTFLGGGTKTTQQRYGGKKLNTPTRQVELWNESLERYDACFTNDINYFQLLRLKNDTLYNPHSKSYLYRLVVL